MQAGKCQVKHILLSGDNLTLNCYQNFTVHDICHCHNAIKPQPSAIVKTIL